jgi:hypothetical protein
LLSRIDLHRYVADVGLLGERVRLDRAVKLGVRVTAGLYNVEFS